MAEQTIEPLSAPDDDPRPAGSGRGTPGSWIRRHPWWVVAVALVPFSTLLVRLGQHPPRLSTPTAGLYGATRRSTSSSISAARPRGSRCRICSRSRSRSSATPQLWLWMITARQLSLSGAIFAGRIVYRLVATSPERRTAAIIAAVFAGAVGARDPELLALSPQRPVGPDDRRAVPRCRSTATCRAARAGRSRSACSPRSAGPRRGRSSGSTRSTPGARSPRCGADRRRAGADSRCSGSGIPTLTNMRPLSPASWPSARCASCTRTRSSARSTASPR